MSLPYHRIDLLVFGNCFLVSENGVHDDAKNHGNGNCRNAYASFSASEGEDKSANTCYQDDGGYKDVLCVAHIYFFVDKHLDTG